MMDIIRPIFSYGDLAQMPDDGKRYEVVEGDLAVSPSPNRKHQNVIRRLSAFFISVEEHHHGQWYPAPFDVVLDDYNVVQPDLLFIGRDRLGIVRETDVQGAPDLVVEVLSTSTRERDLGVKGHLYARFGVREYWVIDPDNQNVSVYRLTADGFEVHGRYHAGDQVTSPLFPDHPLSVETLFR